MGVRVAFGAISVVIVARLMSASGGVRFPPDPSAQQPAPAPAASQPPASEPRFDPAAVERGGQLLVSQCGFCHGSNARGGSNGPDLTRSSLVQDDENGKQLGEFLRVGRPDRGMPKFELTDAQILDLATFLHATIHFAASRNLYKILDIVVGDARAGEAFFNGAGRCSACHSATGDLKGVGAKYDAATLQGRFLLPRGGRGAGPGGPAAPPYLDRNAVKATVTLPTGESVTGTIVRLTDFDVTLYDPASGRVRSWLRNGDAPKVVVTDPLQGHMDMLMKWTDTDMHNVTAYLASLK
jgi:cytochrome c oxidase cbb3-type subunit 3